MAGRTLRQLGRGLPPYLALAPVLVLMFVFLYLPLASDLIYSLHQWSSLSTTWRFVGLGNFHRLFGDPIFWQALRGNLLYAVISVLFQVGLGLVLAAVLEARMIGRRLSGVFRVSFFIPSILPITVIGLLWQVLYQQQVGLVDQFMTLVGLGDFTHAWLGEEATVLPAVIAVSQWQWLGYLTVLFVVAIRAVPQTLYEAAEVDGARGWHKFWHVTMPGVSETTVLMVLITIFGAFKVFDIIWVMTGGGPNNASEVLGSYMYRSAFRDDRVGYAAAIAVVMFVICAAVGGVQLRYARRRA